MGVPKLRFKEFSGEWQVSTVGCISLSVSAGATPSTAKREYWNGDIRWMNSGELNLKRVYEVANRITEAGLKNSSTKILPVESVLIGLAGQGKTRGTVAINYVPLCTNQSIAAIQPNPEYFVPEFLYQNLDNRYLELRSMSTGDGGRGGLNLQIIKSVPIFFPGIPEQKKIAKFLSAIDRKIALLTKKHKLLSQYKKGVMQKIFNQEIRFKDEAGKDFPDWGYVTLGEVLDYEQPGNYLVSTAEYSDDFKTPVLTAGKTFLLGYTDEINGIFTDLPVIIFDDFTTALKFVDFPFKAKSSAMKMLKNVNSDNCLRYIYEAMCRIDFQGGDEHKRYWISQYSKIIIPLPCHDEQIKILEFSVGIDKKIEIIKSKLELTKKYKRGLLQQMFI